MILFHHRAVEARPAKMGCRVWNYAAPPEIFYRNFSLNRFSSALSGQVTSSSPRCHIRCRIITIVTFTRGGGVWLSQDEKGA